MAEIAEIPEDVIDAAERAFDGMHQAMMNGSMAIDEDTGLPVLDVADAVQVLARAILAERERAAKLAEVHAAGYTKDGEAAMKMSDVLVSRACAVASHRLASAIRNPLPNTEETK